MIMLTELGNRLGAIDISGKFLTAVKSLYTSVSACIRINGMYSNWFSITSGLRQGCA